MTSRFLTIGLFAAFALLLMPSETMAQKRGKKNRNSQTLSEEKAVGNYTDGLKQGEWTYYSANGKVNHTMNYKTGVPDGACVLNYEGGEQYAKGTFADGKMNGEWLYFFPSGKPLMVAHYENGLLEDTLTLFFENGSIREQFLFVNDTVTGIGLTRYENGSIKDSLYYDNSGKLQHYASFDRQGKPLDTGTYKNGNGTVKTFDLGAQPLLEYHVEEYMVDGLFTWYKNGQLYKQGMVENGKPTGMWKVRNKESETIEEKDSEEYGLPFTSHHFPLRPAAANVKYADVDELPKFFGGQNALFRFIGHNLDYPAPARENGIQGAVFVGFVVNHLGFLEDIHVKKGAHELLNQAALEVAKKMPRWIPCFLNGQPVDAVLIMPVKFKLETTIRGRR